VLTFAVTGALLGGVGIGGGCSKHRGPDEELHINPGPDEGQPPPEEQLHVNPGPDEDPDAADGGAADGGAADGGAADGGAADGGAADGGAADGGDEPVARNVNPGPVDQPKPTVIVNTVKQPDPKPEPIAEGTINIRKVEDEPPPQSKPSKKKKK